MNRNLFGHLFDDWCWDIMGLPPILDDWQIAQVVDKLGPYREGYRNLPIEDNHEPLVSCSSFGLVSKDYYLNKLADGEMIFLPALEKKLIYPIAWVRKSVAESLKIVDDLLRKHGLFIVITSGWRHSQTQELAIKWSRQKYGETETDRRYANVDDSQQKVIVPHQTGGAVDLELWSLQTNRPLTRIESTDDEINFFVLEKKANITEPEVNKRYVRRLLFHLLTSPNVCLPDTRLFTIHPGEFWHYGYGDSLSAFFKKEPFAIYGPTEPPKNYNMYNY